MHDGSFVTTGNQIGLSMDFCTQTDCVHVVDDRESTICDGNTCVMVLPLTTTTSIEVPSFFGYVGRPSKDSRYLGDHHTVQREWIRCIQIDTLNTWWLSGKRDAATIRTRNY